MEQHDEVFESIPWDRFTTRDMVARQRRWYIVAAVALVAGVLGFGLRRAPLGPTVPPVVAAAPSVAPTSTTTSTAPPLTEADLLTTPPAEGPDLSAAAERFAVELLVAGGTTVANATTFSPQPTPGGTLITVVVDLAQSGEVAADSIALAVTIDTAGTIRSWEPTTVPETEVRPLTPGAEPPPEILSELVRVAARWGTVIETLSSGIADDVWWAELLIRLPSGRELPLVVWENRG